LARLDNLQDFILVVLGSIFGANTRFIIYQKLNKINLSKNLIILSINTFSSFSLGFFLSILSHISSLNYSYQLALFLSVGFLGSLSTFSTFINHLHELLIKQKFYLAFKLAIISITSGILSFAFGSLLAMNI
tara:strand:+ start:387 stop:782 length:396 start_codon:yes stop_codon:yes gene_type:complete